MNYKILSIIFPNFCSQIEVAEAIELVGMICGILASIFVLVSFGADEITGKIIVV